MDKRTSRKGKKRISRYNNFLAKPAYMGDKDIPMTVDLIQYDAMQTETKKLSPLVSIKDVIDKNKVNWFNVTGISDATQINRICSELGLHSFDIKDLLSGRQVVKVVTYNKVTFILMSAFYIEKESDNMDTMQVAFILGENYIVSFQEEQVPIFADVRKEIGENNPQIKQKGTDFLLYILMGAVNALNLGTMMNIEDKLSDIEEQLIHQKGDARMLKFLHQCRINYTYIKRSVTALREEYPNLTRNSNNLIKDESLIYFNGFDDRMRTTLSDLSSFHESLISLLDLYYNNNNMKMNEIMKRLTVVSTLFIPLTFMVGVWGMNFKLMPELEWEFGYLVSWILLALIAVLTYLWMRKQKWF